MSRSSSKSELSPSVTGGGSNINLGKNDVDMGGKTSPSVTSGGVGVTTEVTTIGGVTVTAGASVEISPIDLGVSYDPSENSVSIAAGAELPGGLLGISGGTTIDLDTGEVTGGSVGVEGLGLGVNISNSKEGGLGIGITLQIPFTPIELELGFGFSPKKQPKPSSSPTPTPTPTPTILPGTSFECSDGTKIKLLIPSIKSGVAALTFEEGIKEQYDFFYSTTRNPASRYNDEQMLDAMATDVAIADRNIGKGNWQTEILQYYSFQWQGKNNPIYDGNLRIGYWYINGLPREPAAVNIKFTSERLRYFDPRYENQAVKYQYFGSPYNHKIEILDILPPPPCPDNSLPNPSPSPSPNPSPSPSPSPPPPFPNPPPTKRNKMDDCCKENLKFLRAIYKGLGIAKFPGRLPATIIQEVPKEGEQPAEPPQIPINDFIDLMDWQFRRDDERWGQWEIQIDIKDSDITKEGNQKKSVKFPNLAESVAELEGQILSLMANVDALVALQVKNLAESGMARQEAIKGYLASKAIIKYMAFKSTEVDVPVPMSFTAGAETISTLLEESEGHIKGTDYVEKETLRDVYLDLLQAAAIIRAVHWQRIDTKTDTKSQLLNILKGSVDLAASIAKPQKANGDGGEKTFNPEENFEDFIDTVEDGFRNTTGITDVQNPYGKSPDRRPRIRQIGDNISQAGGTK